MLKLDLLNELMSNNFKGTVLYTYIGATGSIRSDTKGSINIKGQKPKGTKDQNKTPTLCKAETPFTQHPSARTRSTPSPRPTTGGCDAMEGITVLFHLSLNPPSPAAD